MNKAMIFFNYDQCYMHYTQCIRNVIQRRVHGETILAKPALIVAIIDAIDIDLFVYNRFVINDWLEERYKFIMQKYTKSSQFKNVTGIEKPFWHLETDGFWHLNYPGERQNKSKTPSKAWLKKNVESAYFDDALWILLQNKEWRIRLRDYIISRKLSSTNEMGYF